MKINDKNLKLKRVCSLPNLRIISIFTFDNENAIIGTRMYKRE